MAMKIIYPKYEIKSIYDGSILIKIKTHPK